MIGSYWFAFLHAPLSPNVVVLMGTIQVLPISLAGAGIRLLAAAALIFVPSMIWRGWDGAATWSPDLALAWRYSPPCFSRMPQWGSP
ncbi:MAG TPA: hypothetical protein VIT42_04885 [Microlunatus sp.]